MKDALTVSLAICKALDVLLREVKEAAVDMGRFEIVRHILELPDFKITTEKGYVLVEWAVIEEELTVSTHCNSTVHDLVGRSTRRVFERATVSEIMGDIMSSMTFLEKMQ